jgi:23S rRNA (uracil1939-C5)-methyltransferase
LTINAAAKPDGAPRAGERLELDFHDLLANGQAVGRHAGLVVFCFGPLPGERALVQISDVKPKYAVAGLIQLLVESPERAEPFCPVFGECGGCQIQHWAYPAQLAWKKRVVVNALERIGGFRDVDVNDTAGMAAPRNYRNKMSLVVAHEGERTQLGFYRQRSHDVVPIDACPIVLPQLSGYVKALQHPPGPDAARAIASSRHIVARASLEGSAVVTLTTDRPSDEAERAAPDLLAALPGSSGLTNSYDLGSANAILGKRQRLLAGNAEIEETIDGLRYRVSSSSFFQVNTNVVARIFEYLDARAPRAGRVLDLYCGVGTFSLFFARRGADVLGIEESAGAIEEARANAELNGLSKRVRFAKGRVERIAADERGRNELAACELAFLDPPRKGSDEAALSALAAAGVPSIWYLSCDPATLARDLKFLTAKGYRLGTVQPFDMFPQTGHVEALATLERHS